MKKKLLLLVCLFVGLTRVCADGNGTLSIGAVSVNPTGGSFSIVLSGTSKVYHDFQFDLTLPAGLTYSSYTTGELINGHVIDDSDQGSNMTRFTGHTSALKKLTAATGTLLTVNFTFDTSYTGAISNGSLSNIHMSDDNAASFTLDGSDVGSIVRLSDEAAPTTASDVYVVMNRAIAANTWSTITLPFAMTADQVTTAFGTGVVLGDFNGYTVNGSNISVEFVSATAIAANHPYIIKVPSEVSSFSVLDATVNISPSASPSVVKGDVNVTKSMVGVYAETTLAENKIYLKDNKFKYSTGTSKLKPYRAYFDFSDFTPSASRTITLNLDGTTAVRSVIHQTDDTDAYYNIQGLRVTTPKKGVYIQKGKGQKVIMK